MSRARHLRAPRGAPPTRTAVSPPAPGHAQPHLAAASRARPDRHHAERHRTDTPCPHPPPAAPTAPRGDEPRHTPTGTTRSPTLGIHLCGPYVQRRRTRDRAPWGCRTNSSPAPPSHDERCVTIQRAVSGAAPGSARCRPRFRATRRAPRICGCPRHRCDRAECYRLDAPCPGPSRATPTATRGDEPRPYPRAPRGAPPTRTAVSPHTAGHAQPHLAATSRASTDRHHAKPDTRDSPPRTTRSAPPHAPSCPRGCRTNSSPAPPPPRERCHPDYMAVSGAAPGSACSHPRRASAEARLPVRPSGAAPIRRAVPRHAGGHPPPPPAAMSRARHPRAPRGATTDPHRRVPTRSRPRPTAPRGGEPRPPPTGTTRSTTPGVHQRGPHAHRRTRDRARDGCRTNSSPAPPSYRQRCVPD
ncbi:hypothetical protein GobsT_11270 [Gemmata obscuriglobus]|nr:hypothetical protein GobsT_11270 [Gemmata obscuriglobus]VTS01454.1 unnamed protein product [Gemmata obscuriglobus UQM 2246]